MAERIGTNLAPQNGRPYAYPWDDWADGHAWRIIQGDDFTVPVESMRSALRKHADRTGCRLVTRVDGAAIEFQFLAPVVIDGENVA